jgi:hypothetical protein
MGDFKAPDAPKPRTLFEDKLKDMLGQAGDMAK